MEHLRRLGRRPVAWITATAVAIALLIATNDGEPRECMNGLLVAAITEDEEGTRTPQVAVFGPGGRSIPAAPDWVSWQPSFNPTGERLVLVRVDEGGYGSAGPTWSELWTVTSNGKDATQLTAGPRDDEPDWAPTGDIAFVRTDGPSSTLMSIRDDGGEPSAILAPAPGIGLFAPAWSPDGSQIAYGFVEPLDNATRAAVAVVDADGGEARVVAELPQPLSIDWHPHKQSLLVVGDSVAFVVDVASGRKSVVGQDVQAARWSADGTRIVFTQRDGTLAEGPADEGLLTADKKLAVVDAGYVYSDFDVACT